MSFLMFENSHSDFKNSSTITVDYHLKKRKVAPLNNLESKNLENLTNDATINQKANKFKRSSPIQLDGNILKISFIIILFIHHFGFKLDFIS